MSVTRYFVATKAQSQETFKWITVHGLVVAAQDYDCDVKALETERDQQQVITGDYIAKYHLMADERDALAAENLRLRDALNTAKYRIEQGRVWNGMGWTLTGLHPLGQQKALDAIDEALSSGKEVE